MEILVRISPTGSIRFVVVVAGISTDSKFGWPTRSCNVVKIVNRYDLDTDRPRWRYFRGTFFLFSHTLFDDFVTVFKFKYCFHNIYINNLVLRTFSPKSKIMLSQQLGSGEGLIEADGVQWATDRLHPIDTPSITFANYNNQYNNNLYEPFACGDAGPYIHKETHGLPDEESELCDFELIKPPPTHYHSNKKLCGSQRSRLDLLNYFIGDFSQSTAYWL